MKNIFFCTLFILAISACHNSGGQAIVIQHDTVYKTIKVPVYKFTKRKFEIYDVDSLITEIRTKGDKQAFQKVYVYYAERTIDEEMLNLTFLMAHKYNYNYAYFLVYCIFVEDNNNKLQNLDKQSQNLALYYLSRANELGYEGAKEELRSTAGEDVILFKSSYYLDKMKEFDSTKHYE